MPITLPDGTIDAETFDDDEPALFWWENYCPHCEGDGCPECDYTGDYE